MTTTLPPDPGPPAGPPAIASAVRHGAGTWTSGDRAAWVGAAVVGLLAAVVTLWDLAVSGYANTYYSAAAQAASQSWSAMFFGAFDAGGFITVDKPPASLWAMGLSVRILGLSPFAVLLPEALAGIGTVLLLYDAVRRQFGIAAAMIAGVALAVTPVAALMFRFNNPDALLVLLLVAAAWALVRGLADDRFRWLVLAGVLVGLGFLTKYLQAYLVLPGFALTWLLAGRGGRGRRLAGLAVAGASVLAASFWWVAIVELQPAASRPYIGGSTGNSVLDLVFGYDGLGRIFGQGGQSGRGAIGGPGAPGTFAGPAGGPGGGAFGGDPGWLRMLNAQWGGEIGWLLPSAAAGLAAGLWARVGAPRTDARRAGFLLWGSWALVHVLVFSLMSGIAHPYYAVAIAPAAAALTGAGLVELWRLRERLPWAGLAMGAILVLTAGWAWVLLDEAPSFLPGLGIALIALALAAAIVLAIPPAPDPRSRGIARSAMAVGMVAILVGPAAWTAATMTRAISGGDPAAGPADATPGGIGAAGGFGAPGGFGGFPGDAAGTDQALVDYLVANRGAASWLVAVSSASQAGPLQLSSGAPVMAMGGFMGSDPAPTLEQLEAYVRERRLRFVLLDGRGGGPGGFFGGDGLGNVASSRNAWVESACRPVDIVGNGALYDCAAAG